MIDFKRVIYPPRLIKSCYEVATKTYGLKWLLGSHNLDNYNPLTVDYHHFTLNLKLNEVEFTTKMYLNKKRKRKDIEKEVKQIKNGFIFFETSPDTLHVACIKNNVYYDNYYNFNKYPVLATIEIKEDDLSECL